MFDKTQRFVPNQEIINALQEIDVLVLPSETRPFWKEQFGRILIEAMAGELQVVGSDSGEIPNVIGDAGLVFPQTQWSQLANGKKITADERRYL